MHATSSVAETLTPFSYRLLYGIGVLTAVYHLANGLWTQGITWGIWTTQSAMRRAGWICLAFGILLGSVGLASLGTVSATVDTKNAVSRTEQTEWNGEIPKQMRMQVEVADQSLGSQRDGNWAKRRREMAKQRVMVVGGGLAGLAAAMKLAELGIDVDLMSLTPVKRSHSVCAKGASTASTRSRASKATASGSIFDDTVYGGDFLQHQPPVKEMVEWGPKIIDLMDRLGVPFNRTPEGFRDQRRFGGTLFKRTAFAGATTGQQLLYALDEQVRRWEVDGKVKKYEFWDFLGPVLDDSGVCRGCVGQDLVTMEIRAFPADAVIIASGGCGLIYGRSTMSMACNGSAASRAFQAGAKYANAEFIQVHPTAVPGADKLRLMSESARGEGGRVWVPRKPQDPRDPRQIPEAERYYFLEERYPKYGNLVPRDIATREIFNVCTHEGLSVEKDRLCVYLDLTHIPRDVLDLKLGGILEIYEKFTGRRSARSADEDFPRRPLFDGRPVGRLRADGRRRSGARLAAQSADEHSGSVRHRRMRLPVSRRESPRGQLAVELHLQRADRRAGNRDSAQIAQGRLGRRSAGEPVRAGGETSSRSPRRAAQPPRRRRESLSAFIRSWGK